jgi:hypothetical protein
LVHEFFVYPLSHARFGRPGNRENFDCRRTQPVQGRGFTDSLKRIFFRDKLPVAKETLGKTQRVIVGEFCARLTQPDAILGRSSFSFI